MGHVSETAVNRISNNEKEQLENSAVLFFRSCVKPIFTIGIKHKKIVPVLYKIMKECKKHLKIIVKNVEKNTKQTLKTGKYVV